MLWLSRAGKADHPHVLVKTHEWSNRWDPACADHIFLTHRDLRGVLASYQRVGWAFDISDSYVAEHMRWRVSFYFLVVIFVMKVQYAGMHEGEKLALQSKDSTLALAGYCPP